GEYLGGVQPGDCEPSGAEAGGEDKGEGCAGGTVRSSFGLVVGVILCKTGEASGQEHGDAHDDVAPVQAYATSESVEGEDGDEGGKLGKFLVRGRKMQRSRTNHVEYIVDTGDPAGLKDGVSRLAENIVCDLEPHNELHTTSDVEVARSTSTELLGHGIPEHMEVAVEFARLPLQLCNIANILEFGFGETILIFTAETSKNVASFRFSADLDKPPGRFGEEPDNCEEEEQREDLECDGEPPNKG
ncbi:MAG: hypothetical protein Q9188_006201, partial [Gyalolechia gomerana]